MTIVSTFALITVGTFYALKGLLLRRVTVHDRTTEPDSAGKYLDRVP